MLHAHCLCPSDFFADFGEREVLRDHLEFPLERLYLLLVNDDWSDTWSESVWREKFCDPYQLWDCLPSGRCVPNLRIIDSENLLSDDERIPLIARDDTFSVDLVAACLRQQNFCDKITKVDRDRNSSVALRSIVTRYRKFMRLIDKGACLVPTLDIDLGWHTHQLSPAQYRQWCLTHLGGFVDHDDRASLEECNEGLVQTILVWEEAYGAHYMKDEVQGISFLTNQSDIGVCVIFCG
jgi:hypothetical protein